MSLHTTKRLKSWPLRCGHNCGDDSEFQEKPSSIAPFTLLNSTVLSLETFRILGSIISPDMNWTSNIDMFAKNKPSRICTSCTNSGSCLQTASGTDDPILLCKNTVCSLYIHHCLVWYGHQIGQEHTTTDSLVCTKKSLVSTYPSFRTSTYPESGHGQATSLQTHFTLDTICSNCLPPIGTIKHCTSKITRHTCSFFPQAIILMNT